MTSPTAANNVMSVENLTVHRGSRVVVDNLSLTVQAGRITALLGPNGAGKSSLVLALAGMLRTSSGRILLNGLDHSGQTPEQIRRLGLAAVPEGHQVLTALSVDDNLRASASMLPHVKIADALAHVYDVFPELKACRTQIAGTLSGGQQQMVAIAHALMCSPKFMLIDEMSLGLAPVIVKRLMEVVSGLAKEGVGILLIEQFTHLALGLADHACVMSHGGLRFDGDPRTLELRPELLHAAYLGAERA